MRVYKKIALMMIIFILSATLTVYAGATEVTMKSSSTDVKVGDTVTITVSAKCGTGIEGVDSTLEYDSTKLKWTNAEQFVGAGYTNMSGTNDKTGEIKLSVLFGGSGNAPQQADFATLKFEVLDSAKVNENLSIKLSKIELGDSNDEWTDLEDQKITLKVKDDDSNQGGGSKPGDGNNPGDGNKPGDGNNSGDGNKPGDDPNNGKYPHAGAESYVFIIAGVIVLAVVLYKKNDKYKDIK